MNVYYVTFHCPPELDDNAGCKIGLVIGETDITYDLKFEDGCVVKNIPKRLCTVFPSKMPFEENYYIA